MRKAIMIYGKIKNYKKEKNQGTFFIYSVSNIKEDNLFYEKMWKGIANDEWNRIL